MYQIYSLLLTLGFVVLLPRFLIDALRHGKYIAGFGERLGFLQTSSISGPVIWLHCVSVGETQAARPLADLLRKKYPEHSLVVSTITRTGQTLAKQVFKDHAGSVFYFPFDWRWSVRRTLRAIRPSAVLLMETELWPNFLRECAAQSIPVVLVNGRISRTSLRRYRIVKSFVRRILGNLSLAIMQTQMDADRLQSLGFPEAKLQVSGNVKFDAGNKISSSTLSETLRRRFGIQNESKLLLAASTHAPEEKMVIASFQRLRESVNGKPRLMIAPRHPERFTEVASLLKSSGLSWARRSEPEGDLDRSCDVILLDTIGELTAAYSLASIVFVGGSIAPSGGHNILEPAAFARCTVTGPHTHNFQAIVDDFVAARALVQLPPLDDPGMLTRLTATFATLLLDGQEREQLGRRAAVMVERNRGAAERTLNLIEPVIPVNSSVAYDLSC